MKQGLEKLVAEIAVSAVEEATAADDQVVGEAAATAAAGTGAAEASIAEMGAVTFMIPREVAAEAVTATEDAPADAAPPARAEGREEEAADAAAKINSSSSDALSAA
jgi:hypothetical protein